MDNKDKKIVDNEGVVAGGPASVPVDSPANSLESPADAVQPSKRDGLVGRLKKKYPDSDFADDDALYDQIGKDYDEYDKEIGGYRDREHALGEMFRKDPRSAAFLNNWREGADPVVELVRQFGTDIVSVLDDPERQEEIAKANEEYLERVTKSKELEEQGDQNLRTFLQELSDYQQQNGYSDDEIDDAMEEYITLMTDAVQRKFSTDVVDMIIRNKHYDGDMAAASHQGEVRGRNARINEKLRRGNKGDGLAPLDGKNRESGVLRPNPNLGALGSMGAGGSIFERGGERRIKNQ